MVNSSAPAEIEFLHWRKRLLFWTQRAHNKPMNSFAGSLGRLLAGWRHYVPKFSQRSVAPYGSVMLQIR
jgi:hypothetical protein